MTPERARAWSAGPLGKEMVKFALRFAAPLYFGPPPSPECPVVVNSGTASLLKFRDDILIVTCSHVIEKYRQRLDSDSRCLFAVGNCYFDPIKQTIAEDSAIDAAILRLTREQAREITRDSNGIAEAFYEVGPQAPPPVEPNNFVAYGGFPGDLRQLASFDALNFGTHSSGACRVTDAHSDYITCEFEREYWIKHFPEAEPDTLGGLSGGPAFVIRYGSGDLFSYEYAGLIYRMHEPTESLYIRQAHAIPIGWRDCEAGQPPSAESD